MSKFVLAQISNKLLNPRTGSLSDKYFDTFFKVKRDDGFYRQKDHFELPRWMAEICHVIPRWHEAKLRIIEGEHSIDNMATNTLAGEDIYYCFSVLDDNKAIVKTIIESNPEKQFILGGYINDIEWGVPDNAIWFDTIKDFCMHFDFHYSYGCDWSLFDGEECIPRLTMSRGCKHRCKFCTIPNELELVHSDGIYSQVQAFKNLNFKLIYLDDKTYGQADNACLLEYIYGVVREYNPDFQGFIVQTTAAQVLKHNDRFWKDMRIKYVEIGVETFNDDILAAYSKPHNCDTIQRAVDKLYGLKIGVIPNIIVGFPEETGLSYERTWRWLEGNKDMLYSINVNTLALHDNTGLDMVGDVGDSEQNSTERSWLDDEQQITCDFYRDLIFRVGLEIVRGQNEKT